jgi:hypothetical protein
MARAPNPIPPGLLTWFSRRGLLVLAALGALLLIVAEFSTLYEVRAITAVVPGGTKTAGANHLYALIPIGLLAFLMAWGAVLGGSRPAAYALTTLGVVALFVVLVQDLPVVNDEGLLAETYESAKASPQAGFYLESLGAVVLLAAGVGTLVLRPGAEAPEPGRRRRAAVEPEAEAVPAVTEP